MIEYAHIDSVFKRGTKGEFLMWQWSQPEFEYLQRLDWEATEKVDGTNIRVAWKKVPPDCLWDVCIYGKTDDAQILVSLLHKLETTFTNEKMMQVFGETAVCLYGEGYGAKVQKGGGNYIPDGQDFILFDIKIGEWWLKRPDLEDVAKKLGLKIVPIVDYMTLEQAVRKTEEGMPSILTPKPHIMEGLVLRPQVELRNRKGERIITKVKHKDFKNKLSVLEQGLADVAAGRVSKVDLGDCPGGPECIGHEGV